MRTDQAYKVADNFLELHEIAMQARTAGSQLAPEKPEMTASEYVISEIMRSINLQIFKRDKDGAILFDKKGRAMLDWVAILSGMIKLVGKIIALSKLYEMRRKL